MNTIEGYGFDRSSKKQHTATGPSTALQGYSKLADIYSFLLWQFGKAASKP